MLTNTALIRTLSLVSVLCAALSSAACSSAPAPRKADLPATNEALSEENQTLQTRVCCGTFYCCEADCLSLGGTVGGTCAGEPGQDRCPPKPTTLDTESESLTHAVTGAAADCGEDCSGCTTQAACLEDFLCSWRDGACKKTNSTRIDD